MLSLAKWEINHLTQVSDRSQWLGDILILRRRVDCLSPSNRAYKFKNYYNTFFVTLVCVKVITVAHAWWHKTQCGAVLWLVVRVIVW